MKVWQLAYPHNLQHVSSPDLKLTEEEGVKLQESINELKKAIKSVYR